MRKREETKERVTIYRVLNKVGRKRCKAWPQGVTVHGHGMT